jgi:chaperone required for assembly of F1-ATPase
MIGRKPKRFWTNATVTQDAAGWHVLLDTRPVRTPAKAALDLPTEAMAEAIAAEWAAQGEEVDPLSMPVTRSANSAIDRVMTQHGEVAEMLASYAETDLLCYRADSPARLCDQQASGWDPLLDWAEERFGARLVPTTGILPSQQPPPALKRLSDAVHGLDAFRLTALHDLVGLSGSLVLGLAVAHGRLDPSDGWTLSRIDEDWQIEQWGEDEEAAEVAARKLGEFLHAKRFWTLSTAL